MTIYPPLPLAPPPSPLFQVGTHSEGRAEGSHDRNRYGMPCHLPFHLLGVQREDLKIIDKNLHFVLVLQVPYLIVSIDRPEHKQPLHEHTPPPTNYTARKALTLEVNVLKYIK